MIESDHAGAPTLTPRRETRFRLLTGDRIAVCWGSSTELLRWSDVVSVQSERNCAVISTGVRDIKVRATLRAVVAELAMLGLIQVRRDTAVNATRVRRLIGAGRHRLIMILDNDCRIDVGRDFQQPIRTRFASGTRR